MDEGEDYEEDYEEDFEENYKSFEEIYENHKMFRRETNSKFHVVYSKQGDFPQTYVELIFKPLIVILRKILPNNSELLNPVPKVDVRDLFHVMDELRNTATKNVENSINKKSLNTLIKFLEQEFDKIYKAREIMLRDGKVSFSMLWVFYIPNSEVFYQCDKSGVKLGGIISSVTYNGSQYFIIYINVINYDGIGFKHCTIIRTINYFRGEKSFTEFTELSVILSSFINISNFKRDVIESGKRFFSCYSGTNKYMNYEGLLYLGEEKIRVNGRVMIDLKTFATMNPKHDMGNDRLPDKNQIELNHKNGIYLKRNELFNENNYFLATGFVYGFSFALKKWGKFEVSKLTPIKFKVDAFDELVIPERKKELLKGLVNYYRPRNNTTTIGDSLDPIPDKGNGCIILCHGSPGTGKTLTAECVAESLKRPLWVLDAHELGMDPVTLEDNLSKTLEIGYTWNAILLLDEADIYLERRSTSDLKRNMMVCVFLRLLEYYKGILFLTTNRGKNFDDAIRSRISLFLHYPTLSKDDKLNIWKNFVRRANLSLEVNEQLIEHELNGREIRNIFHISRMIADSREEELTTSLIIDIINEYKSGLNKLDTS
ncbi:P-loop containing nucleoside triphosphate hydrolase protein [Gigaspora margarita]|uniref:P-loop containing nucleoside triphosphate hydrolase protein n=1 Tax=Gigaspora margarita TaxID=4874 RepID=A0A8H4AB31_GIGMA|nr:P-loop containing nucleoside triphosphate hydrolase protein [Gigaspora margarita]